ncbi:MAG: hypothetical protein JWM46_602 [Candidatus Kaiserbacteria bacterium]|nr:hypothetical protein [Candidatus Kaiserbacteria bacterium]
MKQLSRTRGFTLLETVVWVGMFTMVMVAIVTTLIFFYRTSNYTIQEASAVASAQHGMDLMVRTMREAAYSSSGAYPIVSIAPDDIVFYADVDSDSAIERVHYYLSGTNVFQGILDPSGDPPVYTGSETASAISDYVRNTSQGTVTFLYYDSGGALISDYSKIGSVRFITVNVGVDVDTNRSPTPIYLRSSAALRNIVGN